MQTLLIEGKYLTNQFHPSYIPQTKTTNLIRLLLIKFTTIICQIHFKYI